MSDGFPSMTALLSLLAVAGFQNRDKIQEMLGGAGHGGPISAGAVRPPDRAASRDKVVSAASLVISEALSGVPVPVACSAAVSASSSTASVRTATARRPTLG